MNFPYVIEQTLCAIAAKLMSLSEQQTSVVDIRAGLEHLRADSTHAGKPSIPQQTVKDSFDIVPREREERKSSALHERCLPTMPSVPATCLLPWKPLRKQVKIRTGKSHDL